MENFNIDIAKAPDWAKLPQWLEPYMDERLVLKEYDDSGILRDIQKMFGEKKHQALRNTYKSKMDDFVTRTGAKPAGCTHVNTQGILLLGEVPKKGPHYLDDRAQRLKMQEAIADAIAYGVNKANDEIGFKKSADDRYPDKELAKRAIELESLNSKGPFDNGDSRLAFQVEEDNLTDARSDLIISESVMNNFMAGLEKRRLLYQAAPGIDKSRKFAVGEYCSTNARRGTKNTLRGGFNCSGDSLIELWMITFVQWLFAHVTEARFHKWHREQDLIDHLSKEDRIDLPSSKKPSKATEAVRQALISKYSSWEDRPNFTVLNRKTMDRDGYIKVRRYYTVDELIDEVNTELFARLKLHVVDCYSRRLGLMGNLQRDQGSPFVYEWNGSGVRVTSRKKRKYRMVEPVNCFIQSWLMAAGEEIVDVAPTLPGRIGMQHPDINRAKMSQYAYESFQVGCSNVNVDLTRFDAGHNDQMCTATGLMYASLYDDIDCKQALSMLGMFCMDKYMIMAKPVNNPGEIWSAYTHVPVPHIKGSASSVITKAALHSKDARLRKEAEAQLERISDEDFIAVCLHVRRTWTPSGIFFTNTFESDMNLAVHTDVVPRWLLTVEEIASQAELKEALTKAIANGDIQAQASGDDITYRVLIVIQKYFGLARFLEIMAEAYKTFNWTLNWKKMSLVSYPIRYMGEEIYVTPIEFLQWLYFQDPETPDLEPRRKFTRNFTSMPYRERDSSLPLVMQWSSTDGRINTALTANEKDLEFGAKVVVYSGQWLKAQYHKLRLKPKRSKGVRDYIESGDSIMYDARYEGGKSSLMCLDQYLGFVKQYNDGFMAELTRYVKERYPDKIVQFVESYQSEQETRAPHNRSKLLNVLEGFTEEEVKTFFKGIDVTALDKVQSISAEFVRAIEELGVEIAPITLEYDSRE